MVEKKKKIAQKKPRVGLKKDKAKAAAAAVKMHDPGLGIVPETPPETPPAEPQQPKAKGVRGKGPAIRASETTKTPGGLLRKSVYFAESEWAALLDERYRTGRSVTEIVREAVRTKLGL